MSSGGGPDKVEETALEREQAAISAEQYEEFKEFYVPMENEHMRNVESFNTEEKVQQERNPIVAGLIASQQPQRMTNDGPNAAAESTLANNIISASENARFEAGGKYLSGMRELAEMGRGIQSKERANLASSAASDLNNQFQSVQGQMQANQSNAEGLGNIIGGGLSFMKNKGWIGK